jgi:hypothetical protein
MKLIGTATVSPRIRMFDRESALPKSDPISTDTRQQRPCEARLHSMLARETQKMRFSPGSQNCEHE